MDFQSHCGGFVSRPSHMGYHITPGYRLDYSHWHPHYEILLILQGEYKIENSSRIVTGSKPRAFVHFPYSLHNVDASPDFTYERYIVTFTKQLMRMFAPEIMDMAAFRHASFICTEPEPEEMAELVQNVQSMMRYRGDPVMCALYTAMIMRKIVLICGAGHGEIVSDSDTYIQDVLQYVAENLSEAPTASELAVKFGVCKTKFHRDFAATVGKSYKQHLTELRQNYACKLLSGGASIIDTALDTGYASESYFIQAFRDYWGMTPGEFIKTKSLDFRRR